MFDMIESEVHGWYYTVNLSCGHKFYIHKDIHNGTRLLEPPMSDDEVTFHPIGYKFYLGGVKTGLQQLVDARAAVGGIVCPTCFMINAEDLVMTDKPYPLCMREVRELSIDTHYSEWSGRHTSIPFWTTRHHGTFIGDERIG